MLSVKEIQKISKTRLRDAKILFGKRRYDGAIYICGYAVELALKARICKTLKWPSFPQKKNEFTTYHSSFKIHDLNNLLILSGVESKVKSRHLADWSYIQDNWNEDMRYAPIGTATKISAKSFIESVEKVLKTI
jgi:HEPN domain-containing protein